MPGTETVTYTPKQPESAPITISGARWRPTQDALESGSAGLQMTTDFCTWILPTAALIAAGVTVKARDVITSGSGSLSGAACDWIVQACVGGMMGTEAKIHVQRARRDGE